MKLKVKLKKDKEAQVLNKNNRVGFTTNQLFGHDLFYFGVFNPKDA